ncbi:MAG: sulfite exporter TauE/SafE family protein, partial [Candidatus Desulforudis sp.]|nr:sulfite exporter TauE/SafE family protein [Desulforudis sp.]
MLYLPIADVYVNGYVLLVIGFTVGVLGGFFGIGGAFMVTPALNIIGFPMAFAVGTDLAHIFGKSIVATFKHAVLKHVDWVAGIIIGFTGMFGVSAGKWVVLWLTEIGKADSVIRLIYIGFLLGVGFYMVQDYRKAAHGMQADPKGAQAEKTSAAAVWLQSKMIPPMIHLKASKITISLWVLVFLGVFTGAVSGLLGVGGGFIRVPMFIFLMGMPTVMAIGTDILAIFVTGAWGAYT